MPEETSVYEISADTQEAQREEPAVPPRRSLSDILAIPAHAAATATRDFTFHETDPAMPWWEQTWRVTIKTNARHQAEEFYALLERFSEAMEKAKEGFTILTPDMERIQIKSAGLLANLFILASVAVEPKLSAEEWGMLGHKVGGSQMDALFDWAAEENGVTQYLLEKQVELAKKNAGTALSNGLSSTPA
jgi:hypothetical protein